MLKTDQGDVTVTPQMAKPIYRYLVKNDYTDDNDQIATAYHEAKKAGTLAALPPELAPHARAGFQLIDSVFSDAQLPAVDDAVRPRFRTRSTATSRSRSSRSCGAASTARRSTRSISIPTN